MLLSITPVTLCVNERVYTFDAKLWSKEYQGLTDQIAAIGYGWGMDVDYEIGCGGNDA